MTDMITRCPKCSTAFRITPTQLKSAKGAVRCGSCLHIFKALEHLLDTPKDKVAINTDDDDFLISDDMGEEKKEQWDFNEAFEVDAKPQAPSLFERKQKPKEEEPEDDHDESWAEHLLAEAEGHTKESGATKDDIETDPVSITPKPKPNPFQFIDDEPVSETKQPANARKRTGDYQFDFEPAPLDIPQYKERSFVKKLLWPVLSLFALTGLVGQFAYYKFDTLSLEQPYRDIYAKICPHLGCQLPKLSAPEKISTYNLVVREHPEANNALMIDIILLNRARFDQPYPKIQLNFSDINNQPLASRVFSPKEYLAGELAGKTMMPANSPIHISLEVVDPGQEAVNYTARVLAGL